MKKSKKVNELGRTLYVAGSLLVGILPTQVSSGGVVGATEFTQIANNAELVAILSKETQGVALNAKQLIQQVELVQTQLLAYKNQITNTLNLPETVWREVEASLLELHGVMSEAQTLALDGGQLDKMLKSNLILDPLFEASGLNKGEFEGRYDKWAKVSQSALSAVLQGSRLTMEDVKTEAQTLDKIQQQGKTVKGQVEAIQVGNELAASVAHQLTKLRTITAAQNEQTSVFQARWLSRMDAEETQKRTTVRHAQELEAREPAGKELIGSFTKGAN